jgi:hypothetical protein
LLSGLCLAAARQQRRVRFATAAALVNELVEAEHQLQLRRAMVRWSRYDVIAINEVGYVPLVGDSEEKPAVRQGRCAVVPTSRRASYHGNLRGACTRN